MSLLNSQKEFKMKNVLPLLPFEVIMLVSLLMRSLSHLVSQMAMNIISLSPRILQQNGMGERRNSTI